MAYQYRPLEPGHIRLLKILPGEEGDVLQGRLHHTALADVESLGEDRTKYDAVSYTWGDVQDCRHILFDGKELSMTRNLEEALIGSNRSERFLWRNYKHCQQFGKSPMLSLVENSQPWMTPRRAEALLKTILNRRAETAIPPSTNPKIPEASFWKTIFNRWALTMFPSSTIVGNM